MKKIARFLVGVKKELKKVRWPKKKEMIVYSTSAICIIVFFMLFFCRYWCNIKYDCEGV